MDVEKLIERLRSHMGKQDHAVLLADCHTAAEALSRHKAAGDAMKEALSFYGNKSNWGVYRVHTSGCNQFRFTRATDDKGEIARAALTAWNSIEQGDGA